MFALSFAYAFRMVGSAASCLNRGVEPTQGMKGKSILLLQNELIIMYSLVGKCSEKSNGVFS